MDRFYLVQRLDYNTTPGTRFWTDHPSNFFPDYMGSAEFEFGAMPASLRRLITAGRDLRVERLTVAGQVIEVIRKPEDAEAVGQLTAWIAASLDPNRRVRTTREWPHGLFKRLEGKIDPTPPPGRGGKEHVRKMYSWTQEWKRSGQLFWDLGADVLFAFAPGQAQDGQPPQGVVAAWLAELSAVLDKRQAA